ncbi:tRNA-modifying protein YgfZ [Variibacter gotjawalensis]|uniref:tRNA-modifying protein YgfZ n=1 Tax=Variibacter gotjawalensis TaxID=1333996 RepID=A0A0S3PSR7_9BRAD|nr:folate-binding protein YgfZ [Variibacter gotjawalensis]NIK49329.1 hypothetical protein [Variibacter gotjawalensis]RZS51180.1 hypothetical protein EV661_3656 [Variibacter gotjawalensis]BAT59015.1 tRNA-modifying protein YgfZ [Variibacter gotjawalensis]
MKAALLPDRGVIKVTGADALAFLNNLVTADLTRAAAGAARFTALLTPQGKIIADFFAVQASEADGGGIFLDAPRALVEPLMARLTMYKLRAKITVEDLSAKLGVMAVWDAPGPVASEYGLSYADPRVAALGTRIILPPDVVAEAAQDLGAELVDARDYETHRIGLAVPRGGQDFMYSDAFPHETAMDQLGGVDFDKGCFIGQEVVSRTQHRGTARTRIMRVTFDGFPPDSGMPVLAGEKQVGTMGSGIEGRGVAMLRLDRIADAEAAGHALTAGGVPITPAKPDWAKYG